MARTIRVNVVVCYRNRLTRMFKNVELDITHINELNNRNMSRAFEEQYPKLVAKIPTWTDNRGFTFRANFECEPLY